MIQSALAILRKDLAIEVRTKQSVPAMALFSLSAFVLFHFGTDRDRLDGDLGSGIFWVTALLASVLAVNRLFAAEREQGGLDGLLLAPIDRTSIFIAKATALFLYLAVLDLIAIPAFAILLLGPSPIDQLPALIATLLLANFGIATVGSLVAALAAEARARDLLVPLLLLPLLTPVLIGAARATAPLWAVHPHTGDLAKWAGVLGLYDLVFVLLSVAVFDFLLED